MLPELPFTLVFHFVYIIVGYPIGIVVEYGRAQVFHLEFVIGVDDGLHMVLVLHGMKPRQDLALEILCGHVGGLMLHIEYRRQVASLQMHLIEEELRLVACRRLIAPEMIGTADEAILTGIAEIIVEAIVEARAAFRGLDHDEAHGAFLNHGILKALPVYFTLIMGNVDAADFIAVWIICIAVERTPAESERSHEEIIKSPDVNGHHTDTAYPPCPSGIFGEKRTASVRFAFTSGLCHSVLIL